MRYTRKDLEEYAKPISDTENETCKRAIRMVKDALVYAGYDLDDDLKQYDEYTFYYEKRDSFGGVLTVLLQGSYANKTNIKHTSDVDVSILYKSAMPYQFSSYKDSILSALENYFGSRNVHRKNKSIKVEGNSGRKDIDVVPAFYDTFIKDGIYFYTDDGERIQNFPLQHIDNSTQKNKNTNYNYKRYVRILKNIKRDLNYDDIGSFQLESLLWNIPDSLFTEYTYCLEIGTKNIINYLYDNRYNFRSYKEGNGIKKLVTDDTILKKIVNFVNLLYETVEVEK
ncbi:MAG: nucleotidyltransferase [Clostridia bacterium]